MSQQSPRSRPSRTGNISCFRRLYLICTYLALVQPALAMPMQFRTQTSQEADGNHPAITQLPQLTLSNDAPTQFSATRILEAKTKFPSVHLSTTISADSFSFPNNVENDEDSKDFSWTGDGGIDNVFVDVENIVNSPSPFSAGTTNAGSSPLSIANVVIMALNAALIFSALIVVIFAHRCRQRQEMPKVASRAPAFDYSGLDQYAIGQGIRRDMNANRMFPTAIPMYPPSTFQERQPFLAQPLLMTSFHPIRNKDSRRKFSITSIKSGMSPIQMRPQSRASLTGRSEPSRSTTPCSSIAYHEAVLSHSV